jgi:photosystem II stability/assembly factor-like uncharacterized protein
MPSRRLVVAVALALCAVPALAAQLDPGLLAGLKARAIGPAGMSGRIAAIDALAGDPSLVYVGAATGGLWRSRNGGLTWTPVFDAQPVQAIGAVAIDPSNRDVVWVGTGEGNPRNSASIGDGVYRSLDGGETWQHLGLRDSERIHKISIDPRNAAVVCVGALGPLWGAGTERGVFQTTDGGTTWRKVLYVDDSTGCADLVRDPRNPNKLFAAMWQHRRQPWTFTSGGKSSGLYVSWDNGETWSKLGPGDGLPEGDLGRIGVAIAPSDPDVVYALVEAKKNVLLRSDDGGRRFRTVNDKANVAPRPFYYCDIRVDPARPDRVYSLHTLVTVSDDGGKTFGTLVPFRDVHPDHHALWIDPTDPRRLLLGNDGGVAESRDRGETWRFVANLPVGQFYHLDVDLDVPYHVYGGMQDNGSWRGPSDVWENGGIRNQHWEEVGFGDGFRTLPDPDDSMQGYSMSQGGALMRWDLRTGTRKSIKPAPHTDAKLRFNWNAGLAQDPFAPGTIYLGSQFVHRSRDRGDTWEVISPDLTTNNKAWQSRDTGGLTADVTGAENFTTILCIAPSPKQDGVMWVATDDGRVHVTRDGGASWVSVEKAIPGVPAHTWVPHVEASPLHVATAFVVFDDHRRGNFATYVYETNDFGATWRSLVTPNLRGYAHTIAQDLVDKDLLFLGTEFGLWFTLDGGKAWHSFTHGIPAGVAVMGLAVHPREHDLVVGTHGRAAFVIDDIRPLRELSAATLTQSLSVFTSGPATQHTTKQTGGSRFPGHGEFKGATRPYGALVAFSVADDKLPHPDSLVERARKNKAPAPPTQGAAADPARPDAAKDSKDKSDKEKTPKVTLEVRDLQGQLLRTFKRPVHQGLNRVAWDLRRKGHKSPRSPRNDEERPRDDDDEPAGAEVAPGEYVITVHYKDQSATTPITVQPDPRVDLPAADRAAKAEALDHAGRLRGALAAALERIQAVRADLDAVDKKLAPEPAADGSNPPDRHADLKAKMRAVREQLTALEKQIWTPSDTKGIPDAEHALAAVGEAASALGSSWHKPTAAQAQLLRTAEAKVIAAVASLNALVRGDVAAVRKLASDAGAGLLAEQPALEIK